MALMLGEPGAEAVLAVVRRSLMSAVNVSECCARGVERQSSVRQVLEIIRGYDVVVVPFDLDDALAAGRPRASTRSIGASLGDRACLALGQRHRLTVFTGDRRLAEIDPALGIDVRLIR
ncbi:type II toxin-antitoxin system VapC family toxin [Sphingomonas yunnanensis]|nr:type II toxin-antitoxin system VapC family toxin [Sphingomonas yunnanensis]